MPTLPSIRGIKHRSCALAPLLAGVLAGAAWAQPAPPGAAPRVEQAEPEPQQRMYRGSKIIRAPVRDLEGRVLGDIHDLVLGSRRGEIAYAVVSSGGVMGVGKRFHAVPWAALEPRADGRYYVLNADRATLRDAPSFDLVRWPDLADVNWRSEVDRYWARSSGRAVNAANEPLSGPHASGASGEH
jgi:sporulation protein YlmC with PRC-barrel domain